jgi:hypothetical protein
MNTSLRHYSITVERQAEADRRRHVHRSDRPDVRRRARTSLGDRLRATLRPGRRPLAGAHG